MFKKVDTKQKFPELEDEISSFWKQDNTFKKSIDQRSKKDKYVFYDGPPFITGTPHYGSLLSRIAKDVVPRYWTMNGKRVERQWGWDCHGLPIENKVENKLGLKNRKDIEKLGIQKFVDECYHYTRQVSADWKWYVDKIGEWIDFDNSYKTMDQDYMESVMWVFKKLYEKDLVYQGTRTSLYCTRCGTPVSNFEIAMDNSYTNMQDPAITIKFPISSPGRFKDVNILAWTTTPWTLPSHKALVIDPKEIYITAEVQKNELELEKVWLVKTLPSDLKNKTAIPITQAYIDNYTDESGVKPKHARIRRIGDKYEFTLKYFAGNKNETGQLIEKTTEITKEKYIDLIKTASKKIVKERYYYPLDNDLTAEVDIYKNNLEGLIVVEVEFPNSRIAEKFTLPDWFGKEVTDSDAVYPPYIADKQYSDIKIELEKYIQKEHKYDLEVQTEKVIIAKKRIESIFKNLEYIITEEFEGSELLGLNYIPPFKYFEPGPNDFKIYEFEGMVNMEEGTGVVHSAVGFGEIDSEMGKKYNIETFMSINDEGKFIDQVDDYKGIYVKDADRLIIDYLKENDKLFKREQISHRYPFCYRCETPLIYKAQPSWFLDIQKLKPDLISNNEKINWVPDHLKEGRFKKGIETAPDWCISRTRYWASPLPIWQKEENGKILERKVIESRDELRELAVQPITKIVFVRHASRDQSREDGELNEEGWKQVELLQEKLKDEKFDAVYSSTARRAIQTIEEIASNNNLNIITDTVFGSVEERANFDQTIDKLLKGNQVNSIDELDETSLLSSFEEKIKSIKERFEKILEDNKGKYLLISTHKRVLTLLRHIIEGRPVKELAALDMDYGKYTTFYFNGSELLDLHRPKIDKITLKGETGELSRVQEVLDVWMDSASMPYASRHYPFENKEDLEKNFPADFVVEYIAQTRAWFYVMHVASTALFNTHPFENVVTTGVLFGTDGRKMSKSYGNYPDPEKVLKTYGAEALRLYLMGSKIMVGEDINLDEEGIKEQIKTFILPLWNSFSFFVTYANLHNWKPAESLTQNLEESEKEKNLSPWDQIPFKSLTSHLDIWIIARLQLMIRNTKIEMGEYNIPGAVREYPKFLDDLSKWYIRRSRARFNSGDPEALETLYYILVQFIKVIAPITPFISEAIYQNLITNQVPDKPSSVHLTDYPEADAEFIDNSNKILMQMQKVRDVVSLGQSIRVQNKLKVKQPLAEIEVLGELEPKRDWDFEEWMKSLIRDELNVKKVDEKHILTEKSGWIKMKNDTDDLEINLDTNITAELKREGLIRELARKIQHVRKNKGLQIGQSISLDIACENNELKTVISIGMNELKSAIKADQINIRNQKEQDWDEITIENNKIFLKIKS